MLPGSLLYLHCKLTSQSIGLLMSQFLIFNLVSNILIELKLFQFYLKSYFTETLS